MQGKEGVFYQKYSGRGLGGRQEKYGKDPIILTAGKTQALVQLRFENKIYYINQSKNCEREYLKAAKCVLTM